MSDTSFAWCEDIKERLTVWALWARGNQLIRGSGHVLAEMMKRAAGEVPGRDVSGVNDFTKKIEAVDKAIARMRMNAHGAPTPARRRAIRDARRMIMRRYLGQQSVPEIAASQDVSVDYVNSRIKDGETYLARLLPMIDEELTGRPKRR